MHHKKIVSNCLSIAMVFVLGLPAQALDWPGSDRVIEPLVTEIKVNSVDDFLQQITEIGLSNALKVFVDIPKGEDPWKYVIALNDSDHLYAGAVACAYQSNDADVMVEFIFPRDTHDIIKYLEGTTDSIDEKEQELLEKAISVHDSLVTETMSDYDKVKAFHDYIINNTTYDKTGPNLREAYGSLIDGRAVCSGYVEAFQLLCYLGEIPSIRVRGDTYSDTDSHIWHKVMIEDIWYNIDLTWGEQVNSDGEESVKYDYFLISDEQLSESHRWLEYPNLPESPSNYHG